MGRDDRPRPRRSLGQQQGCRWRWVHQPGRVPEWRRSKWRTRHHDRAVLQRRERWLGSSVRCDQRYWWHEEANAATVRIGDNASNRQYRTILSFSTGALPMSAMVTGASLKFKLDAVEGSDPFSTLGSVRVDVKKGPFGGRGTLQMADFQAKASMMAALGYSNNPETGWYSQPFPDSSLGYINKEGVTQFRLRYSKTTMTMTSPTT